MKERGILFSAPMVRAILAGTKIQTRRLVTARGWDPNDFSTARLLRSSDDRIGLQAFFGQPDYSPEWLGVGCPYGVPGDRLWVRETFLQPLGSTQPPSGEWQSFWTGARKDIRYVADGAEPEWVQPGVYGSAFRQKRPAIHMPRWASRITVEVTSVRVERLQDISEADARAEGIAYTAQSCIGAASGYGPSMRTTATQAYAELWDEINAKRAPWSSNPWVWVVEFKRIDSESRAAE